MSFSTDWLPYSTPIDPSEDPPTSIDPLGLTTPAEYLADLLVPGFTVRTWRARLITFDAVAAHISAGVVKRMNDREDIRVPARLVFERLYVAAVARAEKKKPEGFLNARRNLPGIGLARTALGRNEPLSKNNFLKGQAVNGPVGVTTRLAKNIDVLSADMRGGRSALDLLQSWAEDEDLPGVLDIDAPVKQTGTVWLNDVIRVIIDNLTDKPWPKDNAVIWDKILAPLRLDKIGNSERILLRKLLARDAARGRLFQLLRDPDVIAIERESSNDRGQYERDILNNGVMKKLGKEALDENVRVVIEAIDSYEHAAALMTQAFEALLWGLKRSGRLDAPRLLAVSQVAIRLKETSSEIPSAIKALDRSIQKLSTQMGTALVVESLTRLRDDMDECTGKTEAFLDALMDRHERVQKIKGKGFWIDRAQSLTLMPGFGVDGDGPPLRIGPYLHPFRITNSYSMLSDLGLVNWKAKVEDQIN